MLSASTWRTFVGNRVLSYPALGRAPRNHANDEPLGVIEDERDLLLSALQRMYVNYKLTLAGKPVRDVDETLAEAETALNWVLRG